jgi:hypothetical protein
MTAGLLPELSAVLARASGVPLESMARPEPSAALAEAVLRRKAISRGMAYRSKRQRRSKYGDLQRLRSTRGVGRPPKQRTLTVMSTDLVQL